MGKNLKIFWITGRKDAQGFFETIGTSTTAYRAVEAKENSVTTSHMKYVLGAVHTTKHHR
jgi:hypothetical protein